MGEVFEHDLTSVGRTRAVAKITRLASSDESRACVCVKHAAQYLKWTLHFALFYEPVTDRKWHCYTDASWSPEGDYSHQAVAIYYDTNLVAWQSQRQSLVARRIDCVLCGEIDSP